MVDREDRWNPEQYERYRDERSQPFFDLLALVEACPAMRVVDLGCGTGELTRVLHQELGRQSPFREAMQGYERRWPVLKPEAYAALLYRLSYKKQHVRLQVYGHLLGAREDVIEWVKGTLLTDYEKRLPSELFAEFMRQYRERLFARLEDARPYFYPFKRILFWASL